jgi:hypothetical protein
MALVPATMQLQCGQMVNREEIIPLQKGQWRFVLGSGVVSRWEMLCFNAEWMSYRPLQSGVGHLPAAGMSSVQRKDLLQSGHWILNIGLLRGKMIAKYRIINSFVSYRLAGCNYR